MSNWESESQTKLRFEKGVIPYIQVPDISNMR